MTKKELAQVLFATSIDRFRCPLCAQSFQKNTSEGLKCLNGHHFDFARTGYLNLLTTGKGSEYNRDLFCARRKVFQGGLYDPLIEKIGQIVGLIDQTVIVDAGCGEGSLLVRLEAMFKNTVAIGLDISREGVRYAASYNSPIMWCVADLAKIPLADNSVDLILNMLSPANYSEFKRILKPGGYFLKVIPGPLYLQEIRQRLENIGDYNNEAILSSLAANAKIITHEHLFYKFSLTRELWTDLVHMTPLTSHRQVQGEPAEYVTVDLELVCGVLE